MNTVRKVGQQPAAILRAGRVRKPSGAALCLFLLLLTACGMRGAPTPQDAVLQLLNQNRPPSGLNGSTLDPDSVQVRQSADVAGVVFVVVTYDEQSGDQRARCLMTYQSVQRMGGWVTGSGGGGCEVQTEDSAPPALGISAGQSSGGLTNSKFSTVEGLVSDPAIVQVRVAWADNTEQIVDVINESYLVARTGNVNYITVEGLDANGAVVYSSEGVP